LTPAQAGLDKEKIITKARNGPQRWKAIRPGGSMSEDALEALKLKSDKPRMLLGAKINSL